LLRRSQRAGFGRALRRRLAASLIAVAIAAFALVAHAQRVALVRPDEADQVLVEAFNRIQAELRLEDFEVAVVPGGPDSTGSVALQEIARRAGSRAAVVFVRREGRTAVDVWLEDRVTGKPGVRSLEQAGSAETPNVLAIRAVDWLRIGLRESVENRPKEEPVRVDRAPPPADAPPVVSPPPRPRAWEIRAEGLMI